MTKEIEDAVQNCSTCLEFRKSNVKEPLIPHEVPNTPWIKLGTDLINFKGKDYLLIIDYFSKYVDIGYLPNITSESVINVLKASFAKHGIPKILYTDPGTQFSSVKFQDLTKKWAFKHKMSSAKHSQSNGMVERHIQTVKKFMKKAEHDNRDPFIVLLEYRNTPITPEIGSPNQLMFGRNVNGFVPTCSANYRKKIDIDYDKIREKLCERQNLQKFYYDQHVKRLPDFDVGDQVRIQNAQNKLFEKKGVIVSKPNKPRSYNVFTESGKTLNRNRRHLLQDFSRNEEYKTQPYYDLDVKIEERILNKQSDIADRVEPNLSTTVKTPTLETSDVIRTRSGRISKKPKYLEEYEL
ncbi:uncharacterized protein K02A2.6-like [Ooceraea biroi]|uniref:uncharacterized protein K02A2.6-like n=1 Tax=Ooceraea biroi TaxID=2015173 RepID=UPI000F09A3D6|nr:uncharacterized protein K02A2.6-like [Ooceraea biroi]